MNQLAQNISGPDDLIDLACCLDALTVKMSWARPVIEQSARLQRLSRSRLRERHNLMDPPTSSCRFLLRMSADERSGLAMLAGAVLQADALAGLLNREVIAEITQVICADGWTLALNQAQRMGTHAADLTGVMDLVERSGKLAEAAWRQGQPEMDRRWLDVIWGPAAIDCAPTEAAIEAFQMAVTHRFSERARDETV